VNLLDDGGERGLVAIDPAPCLGDPAFDAIDLVFWRADDAGTIATRAERLAPRSERIPDDCSTGAPLSRGWSPWRSPNGQAAPTSRLSLSSRSLRAASAELPAIARGASRY